MSLIDVVVELMWSRSFRAGSRLALAPLTVALLAVGVAGCASTIALDRAVVAYDTTTADSVAKLLLLQHCSGAPQPADALHGHLQHCCDLQVQRQRRLRGGSGRHSPRLLVPVFATSAEENPTISIAPMQGEEFTQRLLTPFQAQKLTLLLRQGYDVDSLLRLMGAEPVWRTISIPRDRGRDGVLQPSLRSGGYPVFRRVMAHLSSVQARHALYVEPLHFQYSWTIPADSVIRRPSSRSTRTFSDLRRGEARLSGVPLDQWPGHRHQLRPSGLVQRGTLPAARAGGRGAFQRYPWWTSDQDIRVETASARQGTAAELPRNPDVHRAWHRRGARVRRPAGSSHAVK